MAEDTEQAAAAPPKDLLDNMAHVMLMNICLFLLTHAASCIPSVPNTEVTNIHI
jgi:hypothetical protein